ncbi:MAG: hypothetical protein KGN36_00265 [Acidobacteriota bacterium]|nr:hypothetical protein [Acidobacteriota bacterium]
MRCCLLLAISAVMALASAEPKTQTIEGRLTIHPDQPPTLETAEHLVITLDGDTPTLKVLHDPRVNGMQAQATGHFTAPGKFLVDPQYKRALLVRHDGKLKMITYWCDVCGIRAYTPGPCVCCQKDTDIDLRDPDDIR